MDGQLVAYVTASRVEWLSEDSDDYTEEHGYISLRWSRTELHESRNDVEPLYSEHCNYVRVPGGVELERPISDQMREEIRDAMDSAPGGAWGDNGDGTYYSEADSYGDAADYEDPGHYSYAVHWHVKHLTSRGWTETPVDVSEIIAASLVN